MKKLFGLLLVLCALSAHASVKAPGNNPTNTALSACASMPANTICANATSSTAAPGAVSALPVGVVVTPPLCISGPVTSSTVGTYTIATLPAAAFNTGNCSYVSDSGGEWQISNGTGWVATVSPILARGNTFLTPVDFGATSSWNGTTGTDDTAAVQAAFNYALAGSVKKIILGNHKVGDLNFTNTFSSGVLFESSTAKSNTNLANIAVSGTSAQGLDISGSDFLKFQDVVFTGDVTNIPQSLVFAERTTVNAETISTYFENCKFFGATAQAAIYDFAGEEWTVHRSYFQLTGGHGLYFTSKNSLGLTSKFATLTAATAFMTQTAIDNDQFFISGSGASAIWFESATSGTSIATNSAVQTLQIINSYLNASSSTVTPGPPILLSDVSGTVSINGNRDESGTGTHSFGSMVKVTSVGAGSNLEGFTLENNTVYETTNILEAQSGSGRIWNLHIQANTPANNNGYLIYYARNGEIGPLSSAESLAISNTAQNVTVLATDSSLIPNISLPVGATAQVGPASTYAAYTPVFGTVTITNATPAVITYINTFAAGQAVGFGTTASLPTGLTVGTVYYVSTASLSGSSFQVADTLAHALAGTNSIATSSAGSGTQSVFAVIQLGNYYAKYFIDDASSAPAQCYFALPTGYLAAQQLSLSVYFGCTAITWIMPSGTTNGGGLPTALANFGVARMWYEPALNLWLGN